MCKRVLRIFKSSYIDFNINFLVINNNLNDCISGQKLYNEFLTFIQTLIEKVIDIKTIGIYP